MKHGLSGSLLLAVALMAAQACGQVAQTHVEPTVDSPLADNTILLDLVVHGKKGRPVTDLKPEELAVTDDGSPVTLNNLRLVSGNQQNEHLITLVFDQFDTARGENRQADSSTMLGARNAAMKILRMVPANGFQFSVLEIERRLHLQHAFTSDRTALARAINAATEAEKSGSDSAVNQPERDMISVASTGSDLNGKKATVQERLMAQMLYSALKKSGPIAQDQHVRPSLAGLLALVQSQQEITQRKAVIYFSSMQDKQIDSNARRAIDSIIGTANQSGVSIYVVDMNSLDHRGLQVRELDTHALQLNEIDSPVGPSYGMRAGGLEVVADDAKNEDMGHLAEETGGSYITGLGLHKSLEQLVEDMTTYYEASYLPQIKEYDGRFRPVVVKPLRAGLKIRTQTGYLALPPRAEDGSRPQPFELPLLKLLKQVALPAELPFRAAVLTMGDHSAGHVSTLAIEVPLINLDLQRDTNTPTYVAHFSMLANIRDSAGEIVQHFSADVPRRVTLNGDPSKDIEVISLQRHFAAAPGQYVLEAAILDRNGGKAAAQRIPFEIPEVTGTPSLSKIVLVRRTDPIPPEEDTDEPLRQGEVRVTPNLSGELPEGDTHASVFFVAHVNPNVAGPAKLEIRVLRDGKLLGGAPMIARQVNGTEYSSYLSSFVINPPEDGTYQVKVILRQDGKTAEADTSFALANVGSASPNDADNSLPMEDIAQSAAPRAIAFPANPIQRPSGDELKSMIADATRFATDYWNSLPNFMCEEVTNRSVSSDRAKTWKHKDQITGLVSYFDHEENWSYLEAQRDGHKRQDEDTESTRGISSAGIFGSVIRGLFRPASKPEVIWKETGILGDGTVQVFNYRVALENSNFHLRVSPIDVITVGYHGLLYVDSTTHTVRRITEIADDVPKKYPIHETSVSVDYDYVSIGGHDYLMPIGAQVVLRKGRNETDLNEIGFRNFHRFGSTARIVSYSPQKEK